MKIKQVQKVKYLGSILTEDMKCDTEIRKHIGITKDVLQKLCQVIRKKKISL